MRPHAEREVYSDPCAEVFIVVITLRVMRPHAEREVYSDPCAEVFIVVITLRVMLLTRSVRSTLIHVLRSL